MEVPQSCCAASKLTGRIWFFFSLPRTSGRPSGDCTVRSESRCALKATVRRFGRHYRTLVDITSNNFYKCTATLPNADMHKMLANKIKRVQACVDARGHHFQHLL
jgi:hypothetical protein